MGSVYLYQYLQVASNPKEIIFVSITYQDCGILSEREKNAKSVRSLSLAEGFCVSTWSLNRMNTDRPHVVKQYNNTRHLCQWHIILWSQTQLESVSNETKIISKLWHFYWEKKCQLTMLTFTSWGILCICSIIQQNEYRQALCCQTVH